jgi:hypothetical protein
MNWIDDILSVGSNLLKLPRKVWNAFNTLWSMLTTLLTGYALAFAYVLERASNLRNSIALFIITSARFFLWILLTLIPRAANWALNAAIDIAVRLINDTKVILRAAIQDAVNFLLGLVRDVRAALDSVYKWAFQQIRDLINTVRWIYDKVTALLTSPDALAEWLLGGLWRVGSRWVVDHSVPLGRWFLGNVVRWTMHGGAVLEDILLRVL